MNVNAEEVLIESELKIPEVGTGVVDSRPPSLSSNRNVPSTLHSAVGRSSHIKTEANDVAPESSAGPEVTVIYVIVFEKDQYFVQKIIDSFFQLDKYTFKYLIFPSEALQNSEKLQQPHGVIFVASDGISNVKFSLKWLKDFEKLLRHFKITPLVLMLAKDENLSSISCFSDAVRCRLDVNAQEHCLQLVRQLIGMFITNMSKDLLPNFTFYRT